MMATTTTPDPWRWRLAMCLYRLAAPLLLGIALPSWLRKMAARDGWATPFGERFAIYREDLEWAPCGCLHLHAVSVGETMIALKFLQVWRQTHDAPVVLAVGTATAYQLAVKSPIDGLTVLYAPIDLHAFVTRYLNRFEPSQLVLVEAEAWPELMTQCQHRGIPVSMINARLSPRSERRYLRVQSWILPLFEKISLIGVQGPEDAQRFAALGYAEKNIRITGSIKFDPLAASAPQTREEFSAILAPLRRNRPIVLAASTHDGEELLLARALSDCRCLFVCVPRHAERRHEVQQTLAAAGRKVWLRSEGIPPHDSMADIIIIDSTGELRDWTAHADVVIIGKSFLSTGGQNPAEAILAGIPVIVGPHMENFEPLTTQLLEHDAITRVPDGRELHSALQALWDNPSRIKAMTLRAREVLDRHHGATARSIHMVESVTGSAKPR